MKGQEFLEFKREQLIFHIKKSFREYYLSREKFLNLFRSALIELNQTYMEMGRRHFKIITDLSKIKLTPKINLKYEKIIGNIAPKINYKLYEKEQLPAYSFENTCYHLDDLIILLKEKLFESLILLAEKEDLLLKFAYNFKELNRRINGLKYKVIPDLQLDIKRIKDLLEEIDRENYVRLKKTKDLINKSKSVMYENQQ